jgi:hypothetical protein
MTVNKIANSRYYIAKQGGAIVIDINRAKAMRECARLIFTSNK